MTLRSVDPVHRSDIASHHARVRGVELHWAEVGSGAPLVLLHGLCDSHRTWLPVAPALARRRRVLMLDLAGHGESARPDASYTLDWHANLVGAWLEELGLSEVDLVGHSYGGGVAQWMLLGHRPRIRRLGLEATGGLGREVGAALRWASFPFFVERFGQPFMSFGTARALNAAGGAFSEEEIAALARYNGRPGTARAFSRSVRDVIDGWGQRRHFVDRAHEAPSLPPIALFWGDDDPLIPVAHGDRRRVPAEGRHADALRGGRPLPAPASDRGVRERGRGLPGHPAPRHRRAAAARTAVPRDRAGIARRPSDGWPELVKRASRGRSIVKRAADGRPVVHPEDPSIGLDGATRDGEPEPEPGAIFAALLVVGEELLGLLRREAPALVLHVDEHPVPGPVRAKRDAGRAGA